MTVLLEYLAGLGLAPLKYSAEFGHHCCVALPLSPMTASLTVFTTNTKLHEYIIKFHCT